MAARGVNRWYPTDNLNEAITIWRLWAILFLLVIHLTKIYWELLHTGTVLTLALSSPHYLLILTFTTKWHNRCFCKCPFPQKGYRTAQRCSSIIQPQKVNEQRRFRTTNLSEFNNLYLDLKIHWPGKEAIREASRGAGGRCGLRRGDLQVAKRLGRAFQTKGWANVKTWTRGESMAFWEMKCHSIARPLRPSYLTSFLPPFPAVLITLCMPLLLFLPFILLNWDAKEKWASHSQRIEVILQRIWPVPALVSAQRMCSTQNKLIPAHSSAAGWNQADGNEAKSSLRRTPWTSTERPAPGTPAGKFGERVSVCVCQCPKNLQTIHKESRSGSFCREGTPSSTSHVSCAWYRQQLGRRHCLGVEG